MKKYLFYLLLILAIACKKRESNAQLIKNCTGIYMLIDGEYFKICNRDDFVNIPNETILKIKYKFVNADDCKPFISCACCILPFYPNEKIIEVKVVD